MTNDSKTCVRCGRKLDESQDGDIDFVTTCYPCEEREASQRDRAEAEAEQNARDSRDPYSSEGWY